MKLNGDLPTILFPIETSTRELDSKLVMASALAAQGLRGIVGHKIVLKEIGRASKRVVWQGKSLFSRRSSDYFADHLIENKSAIMFLHDEGGIYKVKPWAEQLLSNHCVDQLRGRNVNRICVWGERQKEVLSSYSKELHGNIRVTGSPKFDLCLPSFSWITRNKAEEKRFKYSPYILICTRFGVAVHARGQGDPFRQNINPVFRPKSVDQPAVDFFSTWQRDVHDFAEFVILIKEIANHHSQHTVIVRPHPSENIAFYETAFASFKNVVVTRDDSVLPWIRSAELVVHSNCTTGIEAVLARRPVLNFLPACDSRTEFNREVACEAGSHAATVGEALNKAGQLLAGDAPQHVWSPYAQRILHNLKAETIPILVAETLSVMEEAGIASSRLELPGRRNVLRRFFRAKAPTYAATKRPPLDPRYVEMLFDQCWSNRVGKGRIRHLTKDYVVVDPG